ncbi:MAG: glycosyltransferase family 1 protein [Alkalispirochaeta sp.]
MTQTSSRSPRIAIITRSIDRSGTSGSGHHLREMIRHLLPQAEDLDIHLAHYQDSEDEIYRWAPEVKLPTNPIAAAAALNRSKFDVVHFSPLTIVSPIHGLRAKKVATIHSAEPMLLPEAYSWIKRMHSKHVIPRYARRLDALVTVSETSKAWFAEHYRIPPEKIHVTYNACAPAYRVLSPKERAEANPEDPAIPGPYIFHVSRFSERKNPWTMLEAFAGLVERPAHKGSANRSSGSGQDRSETIAGASSGPLQLVLAGKGWNDPAVRERARELGIADRLVTPGFVSEETVVRLLNGAELFWFPSLSEGFGMPNVEAMRCGCPVVTTAVFAIPEIVGDAAVVLDDPHDAHALAEASETILHDRDRRDTLVRAGLEWSGRYSWQESSRVLANIYRRLTGLPER